MKYYTRLVGVCACVLTAVAVTAIAPARTKDTGHGLRAVNAARVEKLLARMSLDEKLALIHGAGEDPSTYQGQGGYIAGVPRLAIPSLRLADGPPGVLTREISGAPPATMALAATFSVEDALATGAVVGRNARARGIDVVLEPFVNMYRDPLFTRGYNTYGEDPLLTGEIAAQFVNGVQGEGVMAQAKHFVAYDGGDNVQVGPQALHEIYLPPFEAVSRVGVSSIMCSYNKVNGLYACANGAMQNHILREQIRFQGFITSDWGATHGAEFIASGLDMEMPGDVGGPMAALMHPFFVNRDAPPSMAPDPATFMAMMPAPGGSPEFDDDVGGPGGGMAMMETLTAGYSGTLKIALAAGTVKLSDVDNAARRVLGQIERFGYLDGRQNHTVTEEPVGQNAQVLRKVAADAAVLLKNDGALPLAAAELGKTLFVGPGAYQNIAAGDAGEKAVGWPARQVGAVQALQRSGIAVRYQVGQDMEGVVIPAALYSFAGSPGLERSDSAGANTRDGQIDFTIANGKALAPGTYAWTGAVDVAEAGDYNINLQMLGGSAQLQFDGKPVGSTGMLALHGDVLQAGQDNILPTRDGLDNVRRGIRLTAGQHQLLVKVTPDTSGKPMQVRLAWVTPTQRARDLADTIEAARHASSVVVFAWAHATPKAMRLPGAQDALIEQIAAVNPNVVVVLNTSVAVQMPWLSRVRAVLQMWYSGDEGGWATADLLTGRLSPAGRLPFTWPVRIEDTAPNDPDHPERRSRAATTEYSEGILMGYRWFDDRGIEPLFPFGYGLSYTTFDYTALSLKRSPDGGIDVSFTVRNSGDREADEVPQVYLGAPAQVVDGVQFARSALAAFARVHLKARESRRMTIRLEPRRLQYWSAADDAWRTVTGVRPVRVGASSRDIRLQGSI